MFNSYKRLYKTIILENNKQYFVAWSTKTNEKNYIYIINEEDYSDLLFCEVLDDKTLSVVEDKELFEKLLFDMTKQINRFYD